jgi:hypothetical protein
MDFSQPVFTLVLMVIAGILGILLLWLIFYLVLRAAIANGIQQAAPAIAKALRQQQ